MKRLNRFLLSFCLLSNFCLPIQALQQEELTEVTEHISETDNNESGNPDHFQGDQQSNDPQQRPWGMEIMPQSPEESSNRYFRAPAKQQMLHGIDISHWQDDIDLSKIDTDFVILKATGGKGYVDASFKQFADQTLAQNRLLGFYHFARDNGYAGTPQEEARFFYETVKPYIGLGIPVLDFEGEALNHGTAWADEFLDTFYQLSGVKCVIYTSAYYTRYLNWSNAAANGHKLWVAQYGTNDPVKGHQNNVWLDGYGFGAFADRLIHQYTSRGQLEGYDKSLDLDIFYGTAQDWQDLAAPALLPGPESNELTLYRVYNPNSGEHFYTASQYERNSLIKAGWRDEQIAWTAPKEGDPVYRLYNPNAGDHHYTLSSKERDDLVKAGWRYEGVGWNSDPNKTAPLYRIYNPNAQAGSHHYTLSYKEYQDLIKAGWRDEQIAWYALR